MTRTSGRLVAVAAVAMLASTTTTCADPAEPEVAAPAWDLTDGRSLARIDWSPAAGEDTYLRHHDDLVVDLPGGKVAIEVEARVRAGQDGVVIIGLTWNDPATGAGG